MIPTTQSVIEIQIQNVYRTELHTQRLIARRPRDLHFLPGTVYYILPRIASVAYLEFGIG